MNTVMSVISIEWCVNETLKSNISQRSLAVDSHFLIRKESANTKIFSEKEFRLEVSVCSELGKNQQTQLIKVDSLEIDNSLHGEIPPVKRNDNSLFTITKPTPVEIRVSIFNNEEKLFEESRVITVLPAVHLLADVVSVYSIVFQQNQFPLISALSIQNVSNDKIGLMRVVASFDPPDFAEKTWTIDELGKGGLVRLDQQVLRLSADGLEKLTEKRQVQLTLSVYSDQSLLCEEVRDIELLPRNHWGGEIHMPELLAAFVTPNTTYCDALLKKTANLLLAENHESKLDGYQSKTRERPYMVAAALWSVICNEKLQYSVPPASFAESGQKIRLSDDIATSKFATCLDSALLFASCLEQAGLNSVIALSQSHAMAGVWLVDESFSTLTNNDPMDLRNRIALQDLILFETTLATNDYPIKFSDALVEANRMISEEDESEFVYILDIKQARARKISPISVHSANSISVDDSTTKSELALPPMPVLPPIKKEIIDDQNLKPDDRVDLWRRKLLDLSKRNKLLNISQKSMGFGVISPDLSELEDLLAAGKKFSIISKNALETHGRSSRQYTQETGAQLLKEFVSDQLQNHCLVADCNEKDLEKQSTNLFRKAKSDFEEGGANTLFLAMGMLRWKEHPNSEISYRAPLILMPVQLERPSATAKVKLKKIADEPATFNLTLIEFLRQDFEIDLSVFQSGLPEDQSGIDIKGIWQVVRTKIKETPGFEVVEELVLSNFSFAKYLMWKDLSDRLDDLRAAPFVDHLIENPSSAYPYNFDFLSPTDLDAKISPIDLCAPLNADSSQLVAIEASAKEVDFVLEGPPGTGKSETIANMIAHNMALGRKVLFVSEKMAALDVVYSRLKKVGLGHLCLELHSNKVSKSAVLEQLNNAIQLKNSISNFAWEQKCHDLTRLRFSLNKYVEELHKIEKLGYSARDAIARTLRYGENCPLDLGWPDDLDLAPIQTKSELDKLLLIAENLGLALQELSSASPNGLSLIQQTGWSNKWQSVLIRSAQDLSKSIASLNRSLCSFVGELAGTITADLFPAQLNHWSEFAQVVCNWPEKSYAFLLSDSAKELLALLPEYAKAKELFFDKCSNLAPKLDIVIVKDLPIAEWKDIRSKLTTNDQLSKKYAKESEIIACLKSKELGALKDPQKSDPEVVSLFATARCSLDETSFMKLPVSDWLRRQDEQISGIKERFDAYNKILDELAQAGFDISSDLIIQRQIGNDKVLKEVNSLAESCSCSLPLDQLIVLPLSEWMSIKRNALTKNKLIQFFAKQKLNKMMRKCGLSPLKNLEDLDSYEKLLSAWMHLQELALSDILKAANLLVKKLQIIQSNRVDELLTQYEDLQNLIVKIEEYQERFKTDERLAKWHCSVAEIQEKYQNGLLVNACFDRISNMISPEGTVISSLRTGLKDSSESLRSTSLFKNAKELIKSIESFNLGLTQFKELSRFETDPQISLNDWSDKLNAIVEGASQLGAWCRWRKEKADAESAGLNAVVNGLECGLIKSNEIVEHTKTAICSWLAPLLIDRSNVLRDFSVSKHESLVDKFNALDSEISAVTGQYIAAKLASQMPETSGAKAPKGFSVLTREIQKKARHKPVRQLIQEMGDNLLSLTPCLMMSPLSVAQFLPSDYKAFDLVIFDEASQITVWDAIGAIARGRHAIIVGDPKQMPPTNFFNRGSDEMDDDADLESILDQALATQMAHHRLTGHYRSRHESLIAFSNHQYYQNTLTTFPCAQTKDSAVTWHRVDGVYAKGSGRNNPIEAQALVAEVVRRLRDPKLNQFSIGIVTFNTEQQRLIEDLFDAERRTDPSLERFFNESATEPIFVKNLETVQGDQRDVICLSVGYGPTELGSKTMSMNFGPLNRQGGERRLNVSVTRAATEMLLFTSFDASMIDLSRTNSEAVKDLKAYVDYAARGTITLAQSIIFSNGPDQFDSDFEEMIAVKLRAKGWTLKTQIGVSKFRIDLGVINPREPGSFLAGIECDGATYHSSPTARDRDRVRHAILEGLGWNLIRIWSTDFFQRADYVIEQVHEKLLELLNQYPVIVPSTSIPDEIEGNTDVLSNSEPTDLSDSSFVSEVNDVCDDASSGEYVQMDSDEKENVESKNFRSICSNYSDKDYHHIEEYFLYTGGELIDPRKTDLEMVVNGLVRIVDVEGPMLAKRAYSIYLRNCGIKRMGADLQETLNKAVQLAEKMNQVECFDEWGDQNLIRSIIKTPSQKSVRIRTLGSRSIEEIPPSELKAVSNLILQREEMDRYSDLHLRAILAHFKLTRLTENTRDVLLTALNLK